jgi:hypothetical protein
MFRHGLRSLSTTAARYAAAAVPAAEPTAYTIGLSKAQGVAKGLTGGKSPHSARGSIRPICQLPRS